MLYFEELGERFTGKGVLFRACFSSRHYLYIVIYRGLRFTLEDQLGHAEDLVTYVTSRLRIKEPKLVEKLQPQLISKAAGVFMWVVLVVDILNKEVQFIHESVRDFLIKDKGLYELWPELGFNYKSVGHKKLKQCCSLYANYILICISVSKLLLESTSNDWKEIPNDYPFLKYASENTLHHANTAAKAVSQEAFLTSFPISNWINTNNFFEKFNNRKYTISASLFYILADKGCPELIQARLKADSEVHVLGERYKYPLFATLANGHRDTVAALLNTSSRISNGVDITEGLNHRKDLKEYKNRTPLSWASQSGRTQIVKLLLQSRLSKDKIDRGGRRPISRASKNSHEAVIRLLINNGANINTGDKNG
ncbi:unnamed protein product [Penicillium salamii]|nr:unnamed protein product [Penicillium salamii]CAG8154473.1 unnamed protein product [Penicillium salamii]CAG8291700.1 unnamed protein product [Penicillium salamii]